jgi:hypothetical protein
VLMWGETRETQSKNNVAVSPSRPLNKQS